MSDWASDYEKGVLKDREFYVKQALAARDKLWIDMIESQFATCRDECGEDGEESGCRFIRLDKWQSIKQSILGVKQ